MAAVSPSPIHWLMPNNVTEDWPRIRNASHDWMKMAGHEQGRISNSFTDWLNATNDELQNRLVTTSARSESNESVVWWVNHPYWNRSVPDRRWETGEANPGATFGDFKNQIQPLLEQMAAGFISVMGVIGNILLFLMTFQPELRPHSYSVYLLVGSVADTLVLFTVNGELFLRMTGKTYFVPPLLQCRALYVLNVCISVLAPCIWVTFSIDRLIGVAYPLKRRLYCTVGRARAVCALTAFLCLVITLPLGFTVEDAGDGECVLKVAEDHINLYLTIYTSFFSNLPCFLLLVINARALIAVKKGFRARRVMRGQATESHDSVAMAEEEATRRMTLALLSVPVFGFLVMVPHTVVNVFVIFRLLTIATSLRDPTVTEQGLIDADYYLRILHTTGFASNLYLLLATSKTYRSIVWRMLHLPAVTLSCGGCDDNGNDNNENNNNNNNHI